MNNPTSPVHGAGQMFIEAVNKYVHESMADQETQRHQLQSTLQHSIDQIRGEYLNVKTELGRLENVQMTSFNTKLNEIQETQMLELSTQKNQIDQLVSDLTTKEQRINELTESLQVMERLLFEKTAKLDKTNLDGMKRLSDHIVARDERDEIHRETFKLIAKRLDALEKFTENQRVDNEGLRNAMKDVEEFLLSRHEEDFEFLNGKIHEICRELGIGSAASTPNSRKRRLSDVEAEGSIVKKVKTVVKGAVGILVGGVVASVLFSNS